MRKLSINRVFFMMAAAGLVLFLVLTGVTMYKQNNATPIIEYHNFVAGKASDDEPWTISQQAFREQMAYLSQNCRVIPLKSLLDDVKQGKAIPPNTVAISIDDGYLSNYELAYPIIKEYQVPVTIFVVGRYIDDGSIEGYPAMQWKHMREMAASGLVDIQSHTYNLHEHVATYNGKTEPSVLVMAARGQSESQEEHNRRIEDDLIRSRQVIEKNLGTTSTILSWPFGAYDRHDVDLAKRVGFAYMMAKSGYVNPRTDLNEVGRVAIFPRTDMESFKKIVHPRKVNFFQAISLEWERAKYHFERMTG